MSDVTGPQEGTAGNRGFDLDAWIRPLCALIVAGVAAYASYVHQREFALQGGADEISASLWPLSVDGLLLLATVGLLKPPGSSSRRARGAVWSAFPLEIAASLAANIAAAPALEWKPVLVSGWPPVAWLLSVELLVHRPPWQVLFRAASRRTGHDGFPIIRLSSDYSVDSGCSRRTHNAVAAICNSHTSRV
ncbi:MULTISPECIES: DUF2637 domain-containing protein [Streptomyces]|uniref:DUF2637 domain-containing protein n=1 Tax=Streptomyces dengpaensis TaxID=2049881 RepID=A0ABN5IGG6_9ACTN|nr:MULTISPECIES: DUF2637 domain-containing protein [Streptomyces]AVH61485.1 DUF2637 domain-containing protein [Streptomyces dengpaensis]